MPPSIYATWAIVIAATAGVIVRPWRLSETVWAVAGAMALVALGLVPWPDAAHAVGKGADVYLFLTGMMLLAEIARREGLFDYFAAVAARHAHGSASRLFALIYLIGTGVTVFLSNDATAVVLTPAVYAAARAARAEPLPYLFICAFIANAASFVLPISNPANLVLFGSHMPPLLPWLRLFALPSLLAIISTFIALRLTQRAALAQVLAQDICVPALRPGGRIAFGGIVATALALLAVSAFDRPLGLPTAIAAFLTMGCVLLVSPGSLGPTLKAISWGVLPLVAGLFVMVEGLRRIGAVQALAGALSDGASASPTATAWKAGIAAAFGSNLTNNLPMGLLAGSAVAQTDAPTIVKGALLIGVDLGPNLSITGSLATILWLVALRREGQAVGFWGFLKLGIVVMPPALIFALAGLIATR